jgi:hypothetical protein
MARDGRHDREAADLDPIDAETLRLLRARDRTSSADPDFAARLLADLDAEIAARGRVRLHTLAALPPPAAYRDESTNQQNGYRPGLSPAPPRPRRFPLGWVGSQLATAALLVLVVLASLAAGTVRLSGGLDSFPVLGVPLLEPASPDPATAHGLLTQMTAPVLPPFAGYVAIERWTYPPHTAPIETRSFSGPTLILVLSGQLSVELDRPGQIADELGRDHPIPFAANRSGVVAAGETLLVLPDSSMTTGNDAGIPAVVLYTSVLGDTPLDWEGWFEASKRAKVERLVSFRGEFAPGPARIALSRTTLQPGEVLPPPESGTYRLVGAESKYLGYLRRSPDGSVTNLEKTPLTVLILTITQEYPTLATSAP